MTFITPHPDRSVPAAAPPSISVVIPAYQAAQFIGDALDSVIAQTLPALEIIVVDDGSTDELDAALEPYLPKIRLLRQTNAGEAAAKNTGVSAARGDLIAILDADDIFLPRRLEALVELATARPDLDLITTDAFMVVDGTVLRRCFDGTFRFAQPPDQRRAILTDNFLPFVAVRRTAFLAVGGFDESLRKVPDWDCWIRMILAGARAGLVEEPLAEYRLRASNVTSDRLRLHEGRLETLEKTGGRDDLAADERELLEREMTIQRRQIAIYSASRALTERQPRARRRCFDVVVGADIGAGARVKALAGVAAPRLVGRILGVRDRSRMEVAGGLRTRVREPGGSDIAWIVAVVAAIGLLIVTLANALSRSGHRGSHALFWLGMLVIVVPIAARALSDGATRTERIWLSTVAGFALYGVKLVRDPFAFTFADELVHLHNVQTIARTGVLFGDNSILPITPFYPGLSSATAAFASVTGLSSFVAGVIIIGAARLVSTIALFLLAEAVLRSDRGAVVAVLAYVGVPNYLFFSAQFAYESLALPLALLVLACVARRTLARDDGEADGWAWLGYSIAPAVVVTHHLTSYALVATLVSLCLILPLVRRAGHRWKLDAEGTEHSDAPFGLAGWTLILVTAWLVLAGRRTSGYLSPVLSRAISQTWEVLAREAPPRALFQSGGSAAEQVAVAPGWERVVGLTSVAVVAVWVPFGLLALWRSRRVSPWLALLAAVSVAYLGTFPLRFVPAAWETASRSSEFLYIGVGTIMGATWMSRRTSHQSLIATAALAVLTLGGVIAGWPTDRRVASTYRIETAGAVFDSEVIELGRWSATGLPPTSGIATEPADARILQLYGGHRAIAGSNPDVEDILHLEMLDPWMIDLLRDERLAYAAVDSRRVASDNMTGYFFSRPGGDPERPEAVIEKFDRAGAWPIFDSGTIVMYDLAPILTSVALP